LLPKLKLETNANADNKSENDFTPTPNRTYIPPCVTIIAPRERTDKGIIAGINKVFVPFLLIPNNIESYNENGDGSSEIEVKKEESKFKKPKLLRRAKGGLNENEEKVNDDQSSCNKLAKATTEDLTLSKAVSVQMPKIPKIDIGKLNMNKITSYKDRYDNVYKDSLQSNGDVLKKIEKDWAEGKSKVHLILENKSYDFVPKHAPEADDVQIERAKRSIYNNQQVHVHSLALLFSLLLNNGRSTLESIYCCTNPIDNDMENVLHLLHFHLSHNLNEVTVCELSEYFNSVNAPKVGFTRLLKLLCKKMLNVSIYSGWDKLATGAYGTVYKCQTCLVEPKVVAIKRMNFPQSIYERCVLHDIFSEITALEVLHQFNCTTELYDYGVSESEYYIIMKKYDCSLKEWRVRQEKPLAENLGVYFSIFKEVLRKVEILHSNKITHYDLKSENVMIEVGENDIPKKVCLGDFGECYLFTDEQSEYSMKSKGTDYIKSPEMLLLPIKGRKDTDKYDRRVNNGTTRASDIWSLGCLLYELLAGQFLFYTPDYFVFLARVTTPTEELFSQEKLAQLGDNVYLVDFLRFILIRDPKHRPNITSMIKRFNNLHELLINGNILQEASQQIEQQYDKATSQGLVDGILKMKIPIYKSASNCNYLAIDDHLIIIGNDFLVDGKDLSTITHIVQLNQNKLEPKHFQKVTQIGKEK
jgi:serine/threonine protein kinase